MSPRPYILTTRRLGMRRYAASDVEALRAVFADPYAATFYPAMNTTAALERWISWNLQNYETPGFGLWALELLDSGVFIGDAGITYQAPEGERILEIGWHVHPDFRSLGYATEAAEACLRLGFAELHATMLSSIVDPANPASIKVATRLHACRRTYAGTRGPMLMFSTTSAQFAARPKPSIESPVQGPRRSTAPDIDH